ncbi:MAG: mycofactocin-coupled SDR family oxidoreductase [Actinomycetales bacterium]|nr:mycofactocin-coupled SDR family oxidoreductase [Actinomycetales bacterium]
MAVSGQQGVGVTEGRGSHGQSAGPAPSHRGGWHSVRPESDGTAEESVAQQREQEGRVALVTGAGRGQGRSHAVHLAAAGARIIALDVCRDLPTVPYPLATAADLHQTEREILDTGGEVFLIEADVRDFAAVQRGVAEAVAAFGRLDVVVANAGVNGAFRQTADIDEASWDEVMDINLKGVWHTCKAAVPFMIDHGQGGSIILISSVAGMKGLENEAAYVAAKHGLIGLMRTMARELAPYWIRVNSVHPTTVPTDMVCNEALFRLFRPDLPNPELADVQPLMAQFHSLPVPWVECADVSEAVLFLAGERSRLITGITLPVDAGALLK